MCKELILADAEIIVLRIKKQIVVLLAHHWRGRCVACQLDGWTSDANESYIGLTITYTVPGEESVTFALIALRIVEEKHTGQNIATWTETVLLEFGLKPENMIECCTDTAPNMARMGECLQFPWRPCGCHRLQLAVNAGHFAGRCERPRPPVTSSTARRRRASCSSCRRWACRARAN